MRGISISQLIESAYKLHRGGKRGKEREKETSKNEIAGFSFGCSNYGQKRSWNKRKGRGRHGGRGRGSPGARLVCQGTPLGSNQCAICRQEGHWKN